MTNEHTGMCKSLENNELNLSHIKYNNYKARKIICILGLTVRTDIPYYSQIVSIIGTIRSIRWNLDFTYFMDTNRPSARCYGWSWC